MALNLLAGLKKRENKIEVINVIKKYADIRKSKKSR